MSTPRDGQLRVTVALFETGISDPNKDGYVLTYPRRIKISQSAVLAVLNDAESDRIADSTLEHLGPQLRLEIFDPPSVEPVAIIDLVKRYMRLLSLAIRVAPRCTIVLDRYTGSHWERIAPIGETLGARGWASLTLERIATWSKLVESWPWNATDKRVGTALEYYYDSVAERQDGEYSKAFVSAAIAYEVLLGEDVTSELSYRLAQRGAVLVCKGGDGYELMRRLRNYYTARSQLVHAGKVANDDIPVRLQQFLMKAIPSMMALIEQCGSVKAAVRRLDQAPFERSEELDKLFAASDAWWSFVPAEALL
jgi:hypothetical protein